MKYTCRAARWIFLAFGLGISCWAPMVPFAKKRLALDDAQLGLVLLMFGIGALITMPLSGWLVYRYGSRFIVLTSGLLIIAILPLLAIVHTSLLLSLALFLFGAGTGALNVSINAQAVIIESKNPLPLMSGFHCLFSTGGLLGAVIVSLLLEFKVPLLFCALTISCVMALILISQWTHLLPLSEDRQSEPSQDKFAFPESKVLFLGVLCFISFMAEGSMLDWSAEFLRSSLYYDASIAGIGYALFSIAMAAGRLIGDNLIRRFGVLSLFQAGSLIAASGFLIVVNGGWGYAELLGFCLIGFGASNMVPILFSASGRLPTASPNYALTVVTTVGYMGMLIGPAFIGFIAEAKTLSFALGGMAILLMAVGLCGRIVVPATSAKDVI
jgi:predicted MFS family arabinose efflux permease